MNRICYTKPSITETEIAYVEDAIRNGWGERCYEYIERFEAAFSRHLEVRHAIATSSCTGALHMGLSALGIGRGDEVILPDISWVASAAPVTYLGATPVFVDILPDTWCIDPSRVETAITAKTKAIVAVHLYGNVCAMDALLRIAKRNNLPLIEDAAEAIGSSWQARRAGSIGTFGTFSFHGSKTITTGEGGMFVTQDTDLYRKVLTLSNHGRAPGQQKQFWAETIGFKYKMSNLQAAIGCAQLERIDDLIARKRQIFASYERNLVGLPLRLNPEPAGTINGFWMPTAVVDESVGFDRPRLLEEFAKENIDARVFFWPLSSLPMFEKVADNSVSYSTHLRAFNLPSYHDMTTEDVGRVCRVIQRYFA
jgi:perosamine synthetase